MRWRTTPPTSSAPWPCREIAEWSLTTLREKVVKIGAKVVAHGRYLIFQMAVVAVPRELFRSILAPDRRAAPTCRGAMLTSAGLPPPPVQGRRASAAGLTTAIQGRAPRRRAASTAARIESGQAGPEIPCETRPEGATPRSTAGISPFIWGMSARGIALAPGNGQCVRSAIVERCDGCRGVGELHVASRPQRMPGRQPTSSRRVSSARCIMFALSACHGTRCQVVEQGRRGPARPAPHWEQAVGRAFLRLGWLSRHRIGPSARAFGCQQTVTGFVSHHEGRES
jgi:hypothetical protein